MSRYFGPTVSVGDIVANKDFSDHRGYVTTTLPDSGLATVVWTSPECWAGQVTQSVMDHLAVVLATDDGFTPRKDRET